MHTQKTRHKHFVAAPMLVLALILITTVNGSLPVRASVSAGATEGVLTATDKAQDFAASGVQGRLEQGGTLVIARDGKSVILRSGGALIAAGDALRTSVGFGMTVTSFGGAFFALRDAGSVTVAALNQPVIVDANGKRYVVVVGMQLAMGTANELKISSVPTSWLREKLSIVKSFTDSSVTASYALPQIGMIDAGTLQSALEAADRSGFDQLHALILLKISTQGSRLTDDAAKTIVNSLRTAFAEDLALLVPRLALSSKTPLAEGLIDAWTKSMLRLAATDRIAAKEALRTAAPVASAYDTAGLPLQAESWRSAAQAASATLGSLLPSEERDALARTLRKADTTTVLPAAPESSASSAVAQLTETQLLARVRSMLVGGHILFTSITKITLENTGPDRARVENVFISEKGRDTSYSFTVDIASGIVRSIVRDGKMLPNDVSIDAFFQH
jgi:hypothetical protein